MLMSTHMDSPNVACVPFAFCNTQQGGQAPCHRSFAPTLQQGLPPITARCPAGWFVTAGCETPRRCPPGCACAGDSALPTARPGWYQNGEALGGALNCTACPYGMTCEGGSAQPYANETFCQCVCVCSPDGAYLLLIK